MKKLYVIIIIIILSTQTIFGQKLNIKNEIEIQTIGTNSKSVPFWFRSNKFGSLPSPGLSESIILRSHMDYDTLKKIVDWGFGFEGRGNIGKDFKLLLIEGYAKMKTGIFQIKAGRAKDVMGLNGDSILSSGNFSMSGNALGIPKLEISIPNYYTIPIWDGIFSFKGTFSHGWLNKLPIRDTIGGDANTGNYIISKKNHIKTYFHQKSFYIRFGKEYWKIKFYGGFNHQVYWSNGKDIYGDDYKLSSLESFLYVSTGQTYGGHGLKIERSKLGNHLGSVDIGIQYDFNNYKLIIYRQNFYDVGGLSNLANIKDGLNGITLENQKHNKNTFYWKKILFELLYTKNQAGELNSKPTKSGDENYYNNYLYKEGWSYQQLGLGTPFISLKDDTKDGLASNPLDYFINNRVIALHTGIDFSIYGWNCIGKFSYSKNFGTYGTSAIGNSLGSIRHPNYGNLFKEVNQFSSYIEGNKILKNGICFGIAAGLDQGHLLNNSLGGILKLSKTFNRKVH
ncbi:hypothetical protein ADIARSV_2701 [Arcticibacter svalbardensis MN12-7]|uniref:Capsule assembly protein Wzi n=1 Tax=Arcticibacter svalbardensis MN12-7 TaxID=1150600 RepID=R9GQV7_9SPHI|nr:capsule assembly Wzi family protein [Arcticibacter svalbardensis]EOR94088.1 hypothetical protein ADIARSV_2701 [Arcticibacter svalbardensis MN12-7]